MKKLFIAILIILVLLPVFNIVLGESIPTLPPTKLVGDRVVPRLDSWYFGTSTTFYYGNGQYLTGITAGATTTINGAFGPNFTFATATASNLTVTISTTTNQLTFTPGVTSGYEIPLSASTTQWNTAFNWGDHSSAGYLTTTTNLSILNFASSGVAQWVNNAGYLTSSDLSGYVPYTGASSNLELDNNYLVLNVGSNISWYNGVDIENFLTVISDGVFEFTNNNYNADLNFSGITANRAYTFPDNTGTVALTSDVPLEASTTQWNTAYNWGNHALAGYLTSVGSDSDWTAHNDYPAACGAGEYVSAIGDTLTCSTPSSGGGDSLWKVANGTILYPTTTAYSVSIGTTTSYGPLTVMSTSTNDLIFVATTDKKVGIGTSTPAETFSVAGNAYFSGNINGVPFSASSTQWNTAYNWGDHSAAGYLTTSTNLTISNFASSGVAQWVNNAGYLTEIANLTTSNFASSGVAQWTNNIGYLTSVASDADWTVHDNYPSACSNQFVRGIGDTLTCNTVDISSDTNLAISPSALLTISGDTLSFATGTMTNGKLCTYVSGTGIECNTDPAGGSQGYNYWSLAGTVLTASSTSYEIDLGANASLEIPNGANPTINATGETALDTTSDYLVYYGTSSEHALNPAQEKCFIVASTTFQNYDNLALWYPNKAITVTNMKCISTDGTSVQVTLSDGTNNMDTLTCATTLTKDDGSIANNTFSGDERMEVDFGSITGSVNFVNYCITYFYTRD